MAATVGIDQGVGDCGGLLSAEVVARLSAEPERARGLPNEAFTSHAFLALERERLFARGWTYAGRAGAIPDPGDAEPVEVAGLPLVLVRGADGAVRAFHNVCPHRGARIVPEPRRGGARIGCPYHGWTFALDGSLSARPHFHGPGEHDLAKGARCAANGEAPHLFEVRCALWFDWIFVNVDGRAPAFEEVARPAAERLAPYPFDEFRFAAAERFEFDCNWKFVAENWIDMYHVFRVHPDLDSFMEPQARRGMEIDGAFIYNQYQMSRPSRAVGLAPAPGAEGVQGLVTFGLLFPNVGITVDATNVLFAHFAPLRTERTVMEMLLYFPAQVAEGSEYEEARLRYRRWWGELNAEDETACRALQLGRRSPAYDGGRFAPYWDRASVHFHRTIAETVRAAP